MMLVMSKVFAGFIISTPRALHIVNIINYKILVQIIKKKKRTHKSTYKKYFVKRLNKEIIRILINIFPQKYRVTKF